MWLEESLSTYPKRRPHRYSRASLWKENDFSARNFYLVEAGRSLPSHTNLNSCMLFGGIEHTQYPIVLCSPSLPLRKRGWEKALAHWQPTLGWDVLPISWLLGGGDILLRQEPSWSAGRVPVARKILHLVHSSKRHVEGWARGQFSHAKALAFRQLCSCRKISPALPTYPPPGRTRDVAYGRPVCYCCNVTWAQAALKLQVIPWDRE